VEQYGEQIKEHGLPISQLELDDMWTTTYGDYQINEKKFPDFKGMVKKLKENYGVPRMTGKTK
jgi:alpha-glucosidase (family GH31 glycosyl hydrolase)